MNFNNIEIKVDGSGIACPSLNYSIQNNLNEIGIAGFQKWSPKQLQNGGQVVKIGFNYYPDNANDLLLDHVFQCHTGSVHSVMHPFKISFAGITGMFYLENYSIRVSPNSINECSASLTCFSPITGSITSYSPYSYYSSGGKFIHADSTRFSLDGESVDFDVNSIGYSMALSYAPIYIIGSQNPFQVLLTHGEQSLSMAFGQESLHSQPTLSGKYLPSFLNNQIDAIDFYSYNKLIDEEIGNQEVYLRRMFISGFQVTAVSNSSPAGSDFEFSVAATKYY